MKLLRWALLGFAFISATAFAGDHSIAFVNGQLIFQKYRTEIDQRLEKEFGNRKDKLVTMQKKLAKQTEDLRRDEAVLSRSEFNKKKQLLEMEQREFQRDSQAYQEDFSLRGNQELQKLGDELQTVVNKVAEEKQFDIVLQRAAAVFVEKTYDITDDVMQRLAKEKGKK